MRIKAQPSALKETSWKSYLIRFAFGGLITAAAGLIAKKFGPAIGGLFLAFPAILPAGLTLVAQQNEKREKQHGKPAPLRGLQAAGVNAAGAAIGSLGMIAFGGVVWALAARLPAAAALSLAALAWVLVSLAGWIVRQKL